MKIITKILEICGFIFVMPFVAIYFYIFIRCIEKDGSMLSEVQ